MQGSAEPQPARNPEQMLNVLWGIGDPPARDAWKVRLTDSLAHFSQIKYRDLNFTVLTFVKVKKFLKFFLKLGYFLSLCKSPALIT